MARVSIDLPASRPQKAAAILANRLATVMFSDAYAIGDTLPSEAELIERFDVGRGTLREALRLLEAQGLITIGQGRGGGPIITMSSYDSLARHMANAYCAHHATVGELLDARVGIEPLVARKAANRSPDIDIAALEDSVLRMRDYESKDEAFLEQNSLFHQRLAEASGNPVYISTVASLRAVHDGHAVGVAFTARSLASCRGAPSAPEHPRFGKVRRRRRSARRNGRAHARISGVRRSQIRAYHATTHHTAPALSRIGLGALTPGCAQNPNSGQFDRPLRG